jgi:nucleoside-diphosphate-sugar epimerase
MRVLVAGASGAIGRPLVALLLAAGHEVVGTTRREEHAAALRAAGASAVVCDHLDAAQTRDAVLGIGPEVVVDQLTSLPTKMDVRRRDLYDANDRIRREGTAALLDAAIEAGVQRYVVQSVAFLYAPEGEAVKDERARPWSDAPAPFGRSVEIVLENERRVAGAPLEGLALRYGFFYGPRTHYASDGSTAAQVRKRQFPLIGSGAGIWSFVHVADAAAATAAAVERGAPGVYNVVDDDPAPLRTWLPAYAAALRAKPPRRAPAWLVRVVADAYVADSATGLRGADNAKAKRDLGWAPRVPSWREGFRSCLDVDPAARLSTAPPVE